jgi:hypothetical protein
MNKKPILTRDEAKEKIVRAYEKASCHVEKPEPIESSDHQPCNQCGNTEFQRTGTCFVCTTCGASQGCS